MPAVFDLQVFMDYFKHVRRSGVECRPFNKALEEFDVRKFSAEIGKEFPDEEVYIVPSVTGEKGLLEIDGRKYYRC